MEKTSLWYAALLGAITSFPVMALFYLGERLAGLPFVPFNLFDWLARVLPGGLVTFGIDAIVNMIIAFNLGATSQTAKQIEQLLALGLVVLGGAGLGLLLALLRRRSMQTSARLGLLLGLIPFALALVAQYSLGISGDPLLVILWLALLTLGWGGLLGVVLDASSLAKTVESPDAKRRSLLVRLAGGSALLALVAWGAGRLLSTRRTESELASGAGQPLTKPTATSAPSTRVSPEATPTPSGERIAPAPGTRPEVTPNQDFYRIDINTQPPIIDGDSWKVETIGLFERPRPLTLDDLMAFPTVTQPITISCISNRIGDDLIGTSNWTGVRLRDILADLGLQPQAQALFIQAQDGFYETVVMEDMLDKRTLLVYGMNDETLPVEHGYPLRIYIPNRYGMKQPKWITRMEAVDAWRPGYWVERGWSREARPHIISIIDTVAVDAATDGKIPVGGIAWAGDRGIQKVEVRVNDQPWVEAALRTPPLSPLTWVQWRYDWPAASGVHLFTVRAVDGTGTVQIGEESGVRPDGATGYHSVTVNV